MSLIQDALKKAERKSVRNTVSDTMPALKEKEPLSWTRFALFLFLVLAISSALLYKISVNFGDAIEEKKISKVAVLNKAANEAPAPNLIKKDLIYSYTAPEPILSGIMYSAQRPLAVINNSLVAEGDELDYIKVIKILSDRVELEFEGKPVTLKLSL